MATAEKEYTVIQIAGNTRRDRGGADEVDVIDPYVPIGATQFSIEKASGFQVGDEIVVIRPGSAEWLEKIGMDRLTEAYKNPKLKNWTPKAYTFRYDRIILAIDGNQITIDAPIVEPLDPRYGGGKIEKREDHRIEQCGIENLRMISWFDESKRTVDATSDLLSLTDLNHARIGVELSKTKDCWVRDVTIQHVARTAVKVTQSIRVTVQDCAMIDPVGETRGGTKYSFANGGQLCLFQRLYSRNARHDYTLAPRTGGPNVFLHCFSEDSLNASESHHRYGHGGLFDNCLLRGRGRFLAVNRGNSGSGHGWSSGMIVFWNCGAQLTAVMEPPTSQNFSIGWVGSTNILETARKNNEGFLEWLTIRSLKTFKYKGETVVGDGHIEFSHQQVNPHSLYLCQLKDRLGDDAVKNITRPWQLKPLDPEKVGRSHEPTFQLSP